MTSLRLPAFTLISGIGWCIDFAIFNYLVSLGHAVFWSNLLGAGVAVSFVLVTARRWIFRDHAERLPVVVLKYMCWNMVAITAASYLVALFAVGLEHLAVAPLVDRMTTPFDLRLGDAAIVANLAKILVTPITMYANFVAVGYIIERRLSLY